LDHEHHETSEKRETANADMDQAISRLAGNIACGSMVLFLSCSQKNSRCEFFCEQDLFASALPEANWAGCPDKRLVWNGTFFFFFPKHSQRECFGKKIWSLPPCRRLKYLPGQGPRNACMRIA
jgi:hypothetical protein